MKVIIAPDKFKGSLTSFEVCENIHKGLKKADAKIQSFSFPMADGGDGFAEVMKFYSQTTSIPVETVDPLGREIISSYEWDEKNKSAIIELAAASGLVLLNNEERNPLITSTFGTGLMINDAIGRNAETIILGLGGSATNDAGTGILTALGYKLEDEHGNELNPNGGNLSLIKKIVVPDRFLSVRFVIACDVGNKLYGPNGAAYVYAPQKGADNNLVKLLDAGLRNFALVIHHQTDKVIADFPGSGAAGGIAAGLMGFYDVEIKKGIELVIEASKIKNALYGADLIITGEGKIDEQSGKGKVIAGIATLGKMYKLPVMALCGRMDLSIDQLMKLGITSAREIQEPLMTIEESMKSAGPSLQKQVINLIKAFSPSTR